MNIDEYLKNVSKNKKLSSVKEKILRALWNTVSDNDTWISSKILLKLTNQKYFDRRVRELKDENGCDIVTMADKYRLNSWKLSRPLRREYLTSKERVALFKKHDFICNICSKKFPDGKGLQADHRKPLSRGGSNELSNWQALCVECNVGKRRACVGCKRDCGQCPWAIPELGVPLIVTLGKDLLDKIEIKAKNGCLDKNSLIKEAVKKFLG